jgi:hypothetical protein
MTRKTLLFVEEVKSSLSQKVVSRKDIQVILVRFKQSMFFDNQYLTRTAHIPTFIIDKTYSIESEVSRFKKFCKKNNIKIDYFYNDSEYNQEFIQDFARQARLPGSLDKYQALCVRDKAVMKDMLQGIGYQTMPYQEISSKEDVISFVDKCGGFPIIVKWRKGLSSKEVYKIDSVKSLEKLGLDFSTKRYIAEKFSPDLIWCIDSLIQNGKVISTFYAWLPYTNLSFAVKKEKFAQITANEKPDWFKFDGAKITQNIVNELKLKTGYMHLEVFVDTFGQPTICEFAWRTPGEHMLLNHSIVFGVDIYNALIDMVTEKRMKKIPSKGTCCVGDMFLPISDGKIIEISNFSDLKKIKDVINGEVYYKVGDVVESKRQYTSCSGWVQVTGKDYKSVLESMLKVYEKFRLSVSKVGKK